jgi:predicted O-linked N-acetylglucosamine transferase (SPINDLY family)
MSDHDETLQTALRHHQAGRLQEAEPIYQQILKSEPDHVDALHLLGVLAHQRGDNERAIEFIARAIHLDGSQAPFHNNLGNALRSQGQLAEAIASYERALQLRPNYAEAHNNLGIALVEQGQLAEAIASIERALQLQPYDAEAHNNLGVALRSQGRLAEAIASYQRALQLRPNYAEAHNNLGNALRSEGQLAQAIASYQRALQLRPDYAAAHNNLAIAFKDQGFIEEAIASYERAIRLRPNYAEAHNNLGNALMGRGRLSEAVACYRSAIALKPNYVEAHSGLLYALHFAPDHDARSLCDEHRQWGRTFAEPLAGLIPHHTNERSSDRRLRIGYVSPNLRDHVVGRNMMPLLREHDHRQFEIFCYSDVTRPDDLTQRLREKVDVWRDVVGRTDDQLAELVREDRIDVLVDLTLHMAFSRLLVFARKPAPVQVTFAGYPGTTGLAAIDYHLTDPYLDPPGCDETCYVEESVRLPDTFWCYDPPNDGPAVAALPAQTNGFVTFGCLNHFAKVNAEVLALWAQVLRAVEGSRLLMLASEGANRRDTLERLDQEGVSPRRVAFVAHQPRQKYLETYKDIDLVLDTFPYNGHTTSLDALWMGVPLVTLVGRTVVGRAGLSQLTNLGLSEMAAATPEKFAAIAVKLAGDLQRLGDLRATLRERMQNSPLMDAPRFARGVEAAYRSMWQRWTAQPAAETPE